MEETRQEGGKLGSGKCARTRTDHTMSHAQEVQREKVTTTTTISLMSLIDSLKSGHLFLQDHI